MLPTRHLIAAAAFALPLLGGCATYGTPEQGTLADTDWTLVSLDGMPVSDSGAHLRFDGPRLAASAGCNQTGADWRAEGGRLIIGPVAATRMFCDGKMDAEQRFGALLDGDPSYAVSGDILTLQGATHRATLRRAG